MSPASQPFLRGFDLDKPPPPEWLIAGVLASTSTALLVGAMGSFKSFVALDMAAAIATSSPWHGLSTAGGPVVYVIAESPAGWAPRVRAWANAHHDGREPSDLHYRPSAVDLSDELAVTNFINDVRRHAAGCKLVVIDTLARCMDGLDESSTRDMNVVVRNLDRISRDTGASVLVVHHTGWETGKRPRGSSALLSAVDTAITVTRKELGVTVSTKQPGKQRHGTDDWTHGLRLQVRDESLVVTAHTDAATPSTPRLPDAVEQLMLSVLSEHGSMQHDEWQRAWQRRAAATPKAAHSAATFNRRLPLGLGRWWRLEGSQYTALANSHESANHSH